MKKLAFLIIAAISSLAISGCSSVAVGVEGSTSQSSSSQETASAATQQEIVVVETSFWPSDDLDYWTYLVLIENPNESIGWLDESFDVEAFDKDGVLLDSDTNYTTLLPKSTLALTGRLYEVGGTSAISELSVRTSETGVDTGPLGEVGSISFSEVKAKNDSWSTVVSGIATSTFVEDKKLVKVIIVLRDKNGRVVEADHTYIDRLPASGKARFENSFYDVKFEPGMKIETYFNL